MRKYFEIFRFNLKTQLNFRANYVFTLFSFVIHVFIFNELWDFILKDKIILGYSRADLIWYIIIGECLLYVSSGKRYRKVSEMVKNGDIANMLTKPISILKYIISEEMACIVNFIVNIIFAFLLGITMAGTLNINFIQLILFFISSIFSVIIIIFIQVLIGMLAFITEENDSFYFVISKPMLLIVLTPLELFPNSLQKISCMLPTSYALYPAGKILVHFNLYNSLNLIICQLISILFIITILNILNRKGVKKINVNGG